MHSSNLKWWAFQRCSPRCVCSSWEQKTGGCFRKGAHLIQNTAEEYLCFEWRCQGKVSRFVNRPRSTCSFLQAALLVFSSPACLSRVQRGRPIRANWPTEGVTEEVQTIQFNKMGASPLGLEPLNWIRIHIRTHPLQLEPSHCTVALLQRNLTDLFSKSEQCAASLYPRVKGSCYSPALWWSLPI